MVFPGKRGLNTLPESWLPSFSSLPLAGETTEGKAGCEDFFNSLLGEKEADTSEGMSEGSGNA
jgi:hypothetical protein